MKIKGKEPKNLLLSKYFWFQIQTCYLLCKANKYTGNLGTPPTSFSPPPPPLPSMNSLMEIGMKIQVLTIRNLKEFLWYPSSLCLKNICLLAKMHYTPGFPL